MQARAPYLRWGVRRPQGPSQNEAGNQARSQEGAGTTQAYRDWLYRLNGGGWGVSPHLPRSGGQTNGGCGVCFDLSGGVAYPLLRAMWGIKEFLGGVV